LASTALSQLRICDFTGQLAGAGATKFLAAFGAQVIRIEDPVRQGRWDILRGLPPFVDERRGIDMGGAFNNHNVEKLGVTLNLRSERGKQLLRKLVEISDVVSENFAAGVLDRWGFGYDALKAITPDIIYVSNCGFGHNGPYSEFKTWGPIVQAMSGLTFTSGLPDQPPAGWGYSYMDHTGGIYMALGILLALIHRERTGEGQWVDMSCTEAGASLNGPALLDYTVNGRRLRRSGMPDSNRNQSPQMAPHGIYPTRGDDNWIAIGCRDDVDWEALAIAIGQPWAQRTAYQTLAGRLAEQDEIDRALAVWTSERDRLGLARVLRAAGIPVSAVLSPRERIDEEANTGTWGLWPKVVHSEIGEVRVDGLPVHLSETDWEMRRGAPCLGEHNQKVFGDLLGYSSAELDAFREEGVI